MISTSVFGCGRFARGSRGFDPKSLPRFPIDAMNRIDGTLRRDGGRGGRGRGRREREGEREKKKKIYTTSRPIITA